jgi:hypothetical protein
MYLTTGKRKKAWSVSAPKSINKRLVAATVLIIWLIGLGALGYSQTHENRRYYRPAQAVRLSSRPRLLYPFGPPAGIEQPTAVCARNGRLYVADKAGRLFIISQEKAEP